MKRRSALMDPGTWIAAAAATAALWVAMAWLSPAQAQSPTLQQLMKQFPLRIDGRASTIAQVGIEYRFAPQVLRKLGSVAWSIENKPVWARFDIATGTLSGKPSQRQMGVTENIRISVTDGITTQTLPAFTLRVVPLVPGAKPQPEAKADCIPRPGLQSLPLITSNPPTRIQTQQTYQFTPTVQGEVASELTFAVVGKPDWATFDNRSGALRGRPGPLQAGVYENIRILASDGESVVQLPAFSITVLGSARAAAMRSAG
jgi:hypothetical protein